MKKSSPVVQDVKEWVDKEYESGRVTVITDDELLKVIKKSCKELGDEELLEAVRAVNQ